MSGAWISWSSGKDSAFALHSVRERSELDGRALLVTVNVAADRVAMHAVRRDLLQAQADRLRLPLHVVEIPSPCTNDVYEQKMAAAVQAARTKGIERIVFGDLFLTDVREYRERNLAGTGLTPVFPLWNEPTGRLAEEIIASGVRAVVTCVDPRALGPEFAGRDYDHAFLADLPAGVDPCGENGEFHTFVWDSPDFASPIDIQRGDVVTRDGFVFCDFVQRGLRNNVQIGGTPRTSSFSTTSNLCRA